MNEWSQGKDNGPTKKFFWFITYNYLIAIGPTQLNSNHLVNHLAHIWLISGVQEWRNAMIAKQVGGMGSWDGKFSYTFTYRIQKSLLHGDILSCTQNAIPLIHIIPLMLMMTKVVP